MANTILTKGNIKKELIYLSLPLLAGNILQQFYNTVDSLMIGRFLGNDAFASTGISATIMNLFLFILTGFCVGLSVLFSQIYGTGNKFEFRKEVFVSLVFGNPLTIILSVLSILLLKPLLLIIHTPESLLNYTMDYLSIILGGLIFAYYYNLFSSILRSIGDTKTALLFLMLSVAVNTLLDYLFLGVFHTDIRGAAYATILAQGISALCCFLYLHKKYPSLLCTAKEIGLHSSLIKKTFKFGFISALHQSSLYIGKMLVQGAVNTLGTAGISAYSATMRIEGIINSFGDSGGQAISIFISQNYGAGNKKRVHDGFRHGLLLLCILAISLSTVMFFSSNFCLSVFLGKNNLPALEYGNAYLKIVSIFYILCFIGNVFVGYFRGTEKVMAPFIGTTMHLTLRVILSYLLVSSYGLSAIAYATAAGWILVVLFHCFIYFRGRAQAGM